MRSSVENLVRRSWTGDLGWAGSTLAIPLIPVSWLWRGAAFVRERHYRTHGSVSVAGLAVVSVGNLAVGGTGKTPLTSWIARAYAESSRRAAILLSGYGDDERLLHERWTPRVPVFVDRDRVEAARRAREAGVDVAVLDDGFQHRRLSRDLDVVLLAAEDRFPGHLLPRGPYREDPEALRRAELIVVTRRTATVAEARSVAAEAVRCAPGSASAGMRLTGGVWKDLDGRSPPGPLVDVLAAAAVARPERFVATARTLAGGEVELVAFRDHHAYTRAEVVRLRQRAGSRPIVTTEKDAVKLFAHRDVLGEVYVLEQSVAWDWGEQELARRLAAVVGAEV